LKGERDKTSLARDKPQDGMPVFEGLCVSKVLQSSPQCAEYTGACLKCPCASACSTLAMSVGLGDGDPCGSKHTRIVDVLETTEASWNTHVGIRASSPKMVAGPVAQPKCIYTNACHIGNKQEELEAIVQLENYDVAAVMETWWDDSHNWSVAVDIWKLFGRYREGRRQWGSPACWRVF